MRGTPRIERGIEIPSPNRGWASKKQKHLAETMQEGDSVLFQTVKEAKSLRARLWALGHKASIRKMDDGFRVWKVKERGIGK